MKLRRSRHVVHLMSIREIDEKFQNVTKNNNVCIYLYKKSWYYISEEVSPEAAKEADTRIVTTEQTGNRAGIQRLR